jgi:anti-sigma-K factor RskA
LELENYIESGAIEAYALGLASSDEVAELEYMRKLHPELNTEVRRVQVKLERIAMEESVSPPGAVRQRILQRIDWENENKATEVPNYTYINIQSKESDQMTVHKWWKYFFVAVFILSKVFLFFAIFFYLKYQQVKEQRAIHQQQQTTQGVKGP